MNERSGEKENYVITLLFGYIGRNVLVVVVVVVVVVRSK
jgi:hypothetical protein